jgi:hypothetical protein
MDESKQVQRVLRRIPTGTANECLIWDGGLTHRGAHGYGAVWWDGHSRRAHRVIYEVLVGPIPKAMTIDHLCAVKTCVNVNHMELVSRAENGRRGAARQWGNPQPWAINPAREVRAFNRSTVETQGVERIDLAA